MQSLSNTRLLSALTLLVHVHVQVATVSAQTTPIWFPRVESEFDNDAFPLRRCNKRNNVAPTMGSECGPRSKTCFFGDKICESQTDGEPAFAYPQHSCTCNGMGSLGVWGCQVAPCPGAPTLPPSPPPTPAPVTPIPSSTPSTESPTDMAPTAAPITVAPTNNPSTSEPSASPSTSEPSASPSKTPSNIPTSSSPTLAPIPANAPIWYRRIENTFSSDKFPLRGCFSRNNIAPPADTMCGPTPKTCFFGDQICEGFNGEADFVFPVHSCVCDGMMTWVCQTTACPGAAAPPSTTTDSPSDAPSLTPPDITEAPVTGAPVVPDTMAPVTGAPVVPDTNAPVTGAPVVPDTLAPVTGAPVTVAPVTPDTLAPVTGAPVGPDTLAPATGAPVTLAPIATATLAPVTGAPVVTLAPATIAPDTNAPVTGAPVLPDTLAPATAAPVTPGTLSPVTVAPVVTTIAPATGAPVGPDTLAPVTGAPIETLPPATTAPATTAPIDADTTPPATAAPATGAPFAPVSTVTQPPAVTDAPVTMAPAAITGAPVTFSPVKPVLPVPTETVAPTTHSPVLGQPIPTDSPVAPSSSNAPSQCQDATITETPWSDTDTDNCLTYELNSYCILYGDDSSIARFNLTANDACCTCGGGARDATNSSAACVDLLVPAETPIPWTDSARGNCSFYAEDPQTRCVNFASEFNAAFNLTVGEACCACAGITPPSPPTCTDLAGWNTASNRTCEQVTRQDCLFETENFGVSVGAACCKCGLREGDPSAPQSFFKATGAISAGGCTPNSANFDMCVKLAPNIAAIDFGIFQAARERWSGIITADSPDFEYDFQALNTTGFVTRQSPENATDLDDFYTRICGYDPLFSDNDNTDDVNICIDQRVLREGVIASSGPVFGDNFTRFGFVHINADEVSKARQRGTILADVVLHEIGHVLGIGLLWASTAPEQLNVDGTDCTYIGRNANRVYQEISGCSNTTTLPIEEPSIRNFNFADGSNLTITNCGTHLNEACFHNELMTSFVNADTLPLSTVTVAMLEDLGYSVDYSKADAFTKADLNASCVCDDPDPSLRLLMGEEPVRGEVPERPVLSMKGKRNVMAYAKEQLNRINEIAMSYMVNNDDGVAVGVPGITVMYVEDGEIYTEYIMNFDGEYTDEEDEEEEEEPIFGDAGSITRR